MSQKGKKKAVAACIRSDRKDIFVEKKLAFSHILGEQKWVHMKFWSPLLGPDWKIWALQ